MTCSTFWMTRSPVSWIFVICLSRGVGATRDTTGGRLGEDDERELARASSEDSTSSRKAWFMGDPPSLHRIDAREGSNRSIPVPMGAKSRVSAAQQGQRAHPDGHQAADAAHDREEGLSARP